MFRSIPRTLRGGTPDLPDVPILIQYLLAPFWAPILTWFGDQIYRFALTRCATHPLVLIAQVYDLASVVAVCQAYYHAPGTKGATPTYTIEQLVRAEIVRAWADSCSDLELEWPLASNLLARWFVGLPLLAPTPDHSTLSRFHAWLTIHAPDALFRDVLTFLDRVDPENPTTTPQIVDTFAMASPAAPAVSVASLLRHLTRRLALAWLAHAPASLQHALPPLDLSGLERTDHPIPHRRPSSGCRQRSRLLPGWSMASPRTWPRSKRRSARMWPASCRPSARSSPTRPAPTRRAWCRSGMPMPRVPTGLPARSTSRPPSAGTSPTPPCSAAMR